MTIIMGLVVVVVVVVVVEGHNSSDNMSPLSVGSLFY